MGNKGSEIILSVEIKTSLQKLYEVLTTQKGLSGWYTPETKAEAKEGTVIELKFAQLTTLKFRVEELKQNTRVVWGGVHVPLDWKKTQIQFDIIPGEDTVTLQFTQRGLPPAYEDLGSFAYLWGQYLRSIKLLLETGAGEPFGSEASKKAGTTPTR